MCDTWSLTSLSRYAYKHAALGAMALPLVLTIFVAQLQEALGQDIAKVDLIPAYVKLLKDQEAEVRTAASQGVPGT